MIFTMTNLRVFARWPMALTQWLRCKLQTALGGWLFPQLDWILDKEPKTLIFCPTIGLKFCNHCLLVVCSNSLWQESHKINLILLIFLCTTPKHLTSCITIWRRNPFSPPIVYVLLVLTVGIYRMSPSWMRWKIQTNIFRSQEGQDETAKTWSIHKVSCM
jgi:hypothetical protein